MTCRVANTRRKRRLSAHAAAASIRIVHFPELPPHGDVSDLVLNGGTGEYLEQRATAAPIWHPAQVVEVSMDGPQEELGVVKLSDVEPQRTEWLWPPRIAAGKL